mgnify:CR=1 FL=1
MAASASPSMARERDRSHAQRLCLEHGEDLPIDGGSRLAQVSRSDALRKRMARPLPCFLVSLKWKQKLPTGYPSFGRVRIC